MRVNVRCPGCSGMVELVAPAIKNASKPYDFEFACPICGVAAVLEIQFLADGIPLGVKNKVDKLIARPDIDTHDGRQAVWISNKLGFLKPEKKSLKS